MTENAYYGRKWKILGLRADGTEAWNVSDSTFGNAALRCTFTVEQSGFQTPWYSEVQIWNLAGDTQEDIVSETRKEGARVIIEAGYENGLYGKIYDGSIFQPLFDRRNVTDYVLTLHCIDGLGVLTGNLCSLTLSAGYDYAGVINAMARKARSTDPNILTPIKISGISENLDKKTFPRAVTIFGSPETYLRDIANDNSAQFWMDSNQLNVNKLDDADEGEAVVLSPTTGLLDTPQQITNGVSFKCLLNPTIRVKRPLMTVKLEAFIRQQKLYQAKELPSPLDAEGTYKIIKTTHVGDTRGNDWYTEALGVNLAGNVPLLLSGEKN